MSPTLLNVVHAEKPATATSESNPIYVFFISFLCIFRNLSHDKILMMKLVIAPTRNPRNPAPENPCPQPRGPKKLCAKIAPPIAKPIGISQRTASMPTRKPDFTNFIITIPAPLRLKPARLLFFPVQRTVCAWVLGHKICQALILSSLCRLYHRLSSTTPRNEAWMQLFLGLFSNFSLEAHQMRFHVYV